MVFIVPCAPREVNLPSPVRDQLLACGCRDGPPKPDALDEAVKIVYELMNDSVLIPFLESVSPRTESINHSDVRDSLQGRPRARNTIGTSRPGGRSRFSGASFLPQLSIGSHSPTHQSAFSSAEPGEGGMMTDESGDAGSPSTSEPMTPPTTPPTSDWIVNPSPNTAHRATSGHNIGWRRVGAKLGFGRKNRVPLPRRNTSTSSLNSSDWDLPMVDASATRNTEQYGYP